MFKGYLEWSGTELINVQRTQAYVDHLAPNLIDRQPTAGTLHLVNGEDDYRTPLLDEAPWSNRYDPATDQFYGLLPLDIQGIGDSTYAATTTESIEAGGSTQEGRDATRTIKVSGLLVGGTELGAEAGLVWLRAALGSGDCDDQCGGGYLRYFLTEPALCPVRWGAELPDGDRTKSFGSLDAGRRLAYRWTTTEVDKSMPSRATWSTSATEGVEYEYGALGSDGSTLFSERVSPLRVNYALNPTFRTSAQGWAGNPHPWQSSGGLDDGGYLTVRATPGTVDTNPDSRAGAYGDGPYGAGTYGQGANGFILADDPIIDGGGVDTENGGGTPDPAPTDPPAVSANIGSATWLSPTGTVTVSLALRGSGAAVSLRLVNAGTGVQVGVKTVVVGAEWTRVSITGDTSGTILRLTSDGDFDMDQVLCELTDMALDYFDGSIEPPTGYQVTWAGDVDGSASLQRRVAPMQLTAADSDYSPYFSVIRGHAANVRLTWAYRHSIDIAGQLQPIDRSLHSVDVTQSAQIVQSFAGSASAGGYFIQVEFLLTANNPFSYSPAVPVSTTPLLAGAFTDPPRPSVLADDWLFDPNALVPSPAPAAPSVLADAIDASITSWQRYYIDIPAEEVADWASSVPLLQVNTHGAPAHPIRVRFHPNPFGYDVTQVDPSAYCSDFLISYLPPRTSLMLNGISQSASASKAGVASVPADSILYGSDGGPMTWPHLSCGIGYVMTVDVPSTSDFDLFDIELSLLREE